MNGSRCGPLAIPVPVGPLFCVVKGPTRGRPWAAAAARSTETIGARREWTVEEEGDRLVDDGRVDDVVRKAIAAAFHTRTPGRAVGVGADLPVNESALAVCVSSPELALTQTRPA
jgi:hypothetical protein